MTAFEPINVPQVAKLRVSDFLLLNDAGAFEGYAKSELIEGEIWVMNATYSDHGKAHFELSFQLRLALQSAGVAAKIYNATSVELSDNSLPEPDLVVAADHSGGPIPLAKLMLLIEVSDATLATDLSRKARLYANHGVPEYWVTDVEGKRIVRMWQPGVAGYAKTDEFKFGSQIDCATLPGVFVDLSSL